MRTSRDNRRTIAGLVAVILVALTLAACSDDGSSGSSGGARQAPLTGTVWVLDGGALVGGATNVAVTAQFADGRVTGESGCNRYFAPYTADAKQGTMTIGPNIGGTRIACTGAARDVEQAYLALLPKVAGYEATSDSLTLLDSDGIKLLHFTATNGAEAIKGAWDVTSYYAGTALVSPAVGSTANATFDGTQISGTGGCNTFSGPYTVDGDTIAIGPLTSTLRACTDPGVDQQEQQYLQALALAKTFAVAGDRLDLFRADGGFAVSYQRAASK
jgi:heat shock protein HslJ